jgi:hypothetical protein
MATGFHRSASGRFTARFDEIERGLLRSLVEQLIALLSAGEEPDPDADPLARMVGMEPPSSTSVPEDPAVARLLPAAYRDDPEAAAEFRRFTERSLRDTKLSHARTVLACIERSGEKLVLSEGEATSWLLAINDLRLALGTRLGIAQDDPRLEDDYTDGFDDDEEVDGDEGDGSEDSGDAEDAMLQVYDWVTYLQDSLVRALSRTIT